MGTIKRKRKQVIVLPSMLSLARAAKRRRRPFKYVPKYWIELAYDGFSRDMDRAVFRVAKTVLGGHGYSDGSGFGFLDGKRDHSWNIADAAKAKKLARTLAKIKDIPGLRVSIQAPPVQLVPRIRP
jgi:hypothetical protein